MTTRSKKDIINEAIDLLVIYEDDAFDALFKTINIEADICELRESFENEMKYMQKWIDTLSAYEEYELCQRFKVQMKNQEEYYQQKIQNKNEKTTRELINDELNTIYSICARNENLQLRKIMNINDRYSAFDCTLQSGNTIFIAEIKNRTFQANKYTDTMIEKVKVDEICRQTNNMQHIANKLGFILRPVYIANFTDTSLLFFLDEECKKSGSINVKYATAAEQDHSIVKKKVYYYSIEKGEKL